MPFSSDSPLILASASRYRAELLGRLRVPFVQEAAQIDETPGPREAAQKLAERLAREKASTLARRNPGRWVLGCDQVGSCEGRLLGKPGGRDQAIEQLGLLSGRYAMFCTAVALVGEHAELGFRVFPALDVTVVKLRRLRRDAIERYVDAEPALDCAGGFKCEGLGISLFEEIQSRDPSALIGLPLIATRKLLGKAGYSLP